MSGDFLNLGTVEYNPLRLSGSFNLPVFARAPASG